MTMQDAVSRGFQGHDTSFCYAEKGLFSKDLLAALNVSSTYVKAWVRMALISKSPQCFNLALEEARAEAEVLASPLASIFSEVYR